MFFRHLPQASGRYRLGRHVLHDPRSRAYDAREIARPRPLEDVLHKARVAPWNQGNIGSCTANAALGCLNTDPNPSDRNFDEQDAQALYRAETRIDDTEIPGSWEPEDTGSTGLWSMKALKNAGLIRSYHHAFRLSTVLHLLLDRPVSTGITWYESMFDVDSDHTIRVDFDSQVAGGHQICMVGMDVEREAVRVRNSWGPSWADSGYAWLRWEDYDELLADSGDAVVPVVN
ncbi:C1 family peptidase [Amycolatopsis sp. NPDC004368]